MELKLTLSKRAEEEIATYGLLQDATYVAALEEERCAYTRQFRRYQHLPTRAGTAHRNMLKALRMCPHMNTPQEWARLHAGEAKISKP